MYNNGNSNNYGSHNNQYKCPCDNCPMRESSYVYAGYNRVGVGPNPFGYYGSKFTQPLTDEQIKELRENS